MADLCRLFLFYITTFVVIQCSMCSYLYTALAIQLYTANSANSFRLFVSVTFSTIHYTVQLSAIMNILLHYIKCDV